MHEIPKNVVILLAPRFSPGFQRGAMCAPRFGFLGPVAPAYQELAYIGPLGFLPEGRPMRKKCRIVDDDDDDVVMDSADSKTIFLLELELKRRSINDNVFNFFWNK